tara:strand:- start:3345 stop:3671 length:327 start_codon:yes stop_codon:yes gene_type:complete
MEKQIELNENDVENIIFSMKLARQVAKFFGNMNEFVSWSFRFEKLMIDKNAESAQENREDITKAKQQKIIEQKEKLPEVIPKELSKGMYGDLTYDENRVGEVYEPRQQ